MFGFQNGDLVKLEDGKIGRVIRNYIGSCYFNVEILDENGKGTNYFRVLHRNEMEKIKN